MSLIEDSDIEIHSYAPSEAAGAVRMRREHKLASADIVLKGSSGHELQVTQDRVKLIAERMEKLHSRWVERKVDLLSNYLSKDNGVEENGSENGSKPIGNWRVAIKEAYWDGLSITTRQEYRLSKKETTPATNADFDDHDYIQDLVTSYTFDFYRMLRACERSNVTPSTALHLAKLAYRFNPDILINLTKKYPDMNASIITRAATNYSNPDAFLDRVKTAIERLTQKYPDMDSYIITRVAVHHPSDPDTFLDGVGTAIERLTQKYPGMDKYIIKTAAVDYPSDPDTFLDRVKKTADRLTRKYSDMNASIITRAATNYSNPDAFLDRVKKTADRLTKKYPDMDAYVIKTAAVGYPSDPDTFLDRVKKTADRLTRKYPDMDSYIITRVAAHHPSDPDAFLDGVGTAIKTLTQKYPGMDAYTIKYAAVSYPSDPDAFLDGIIEGDIEEYLEFWVYFTKNNFKDRALRGGYLTSSDLATLETVFEGGGKVKVSEEVKRKLEIAVANLAE